LQDDLQRVKEIIKENYPKDAKINKTAIVAAWRLSDFRTNQIIYGKLLDL